jgi:segregation and condensation protein A
VAEHEEVKPEFTPPAEAAAPEKLDAPASGASEAYRVQLEMYEGPMDLLLDLIRKQEIDIHNIPIAKITGQYLDYLHQLEQLDIDVSADFIYMAATLIYIKSKMLLPPDPMALAEELGDPRDELVQRLLEYEQFKNAAQMLREKSQIEAHVWSHPDRSMYASEETEGEIVVSLVDVVKAFQAVLERRKEITRIELRHDTFTVAQMMELLRRQLVASEEPVSLVSFFESCPSRHAMIVGFLAVLEMVRMQAILLVQETMFGEISMRKHRMFDAVFSGGEAMTQIDEQYL